VVGKCVWKRRKEVGEKTYWHVLVTFPIAGDNEMAFTLEAFSEMAVRMGGNVSSKDSHHLHLDLYASMS